MGELWNSIRKPDKKYDTQENFNRNKMNTNLENREIDSLRSRIRRFNNSPGAITSNIIAAEGAKKLFEDPKYKEDLFFKNNPDLRRVESLLGHVIQSEMLEELGITHPEFYSGSYQDVLDQFNYNNLTTRAGKLFEGIFLPYLSLLEENECYNAKKLPESIRQLYENYTTKEMNQGIIFGIYMGLYNMDIIKKCVKGDLDREVLLEAMVKREDVRQYLRVDELIKDKLPEELMGFVKEQCKEGQEERE